ncbi:hypothetical protein [Roseovarius sp. MMSF_3359]|uniref:hypothetical protein n=1 Tax=Roseovarius sp. MMSF_3359 TaxID=3046707 RepID=UPI00273E51EB|nr:hypothetical protein [Roseovarius sp. MMSF_3359]
MFSRRTFIALAVAVLVSGCDVPEVETYSPYAIRNVTVDTSRFAGFTGTLSEYSNDVVARDIRAALLKSFNELEQGSRPVNVHFSLQDMKVRSLGESILGNARNEVSGAFVVKDAGSGKTVSEGTLKFTGASKGEGSAPLIDQYTKPRRQLQYSGLIEEFAEQASEKIFLRHRKVGAE